MYKSLYGLKCIDKKFSTFEVGEPLEMDSALRLLGYDRGSANLGIRLNKWGKNTYACLFASNENHRSEPATLIWDERFVITGNLVMLKSVPGFGCIAQWDGMSKLELIKISHLYHVINSDGCIEDSEFSYDMTVKLLKAYLEESPSLAYTEE